LTTNSFKLTGTINVSAKPNATVVPVSFGIGSYRETLPAARWIKGTGNVYTYTKPKGEVGVVTAMMLNFDQGRWSAAGVGADLRFLSTNATTAVVIEIGAFTATYPAKLLPQSGRYRY
jgi:hypothetical protein